MGSYLIPCLFFKSSSMFPLLCHFLFPSKTFVAFIVFSSLSLPLKSNYSISYNQINFYFLYFILSSISPTPLMSYFHLMSPIHFSRSSFQYIFSLSPLSFTFRYIFLSSFLHFLPSVIYQFSINSCFTIA